MSKVLERILLDRFQRVLGSRDQQFGLKRGHSCSDCSFVLKGSVDYYLSNGNQAMYSAAFDLSNAYDRVSYYRLFQKLLDRGCPTNFVRLLYTWYGNQNFRISSYIVTKRRSSPFYTIDPLQGLPTRFPLLQYRYYSSLERKKSPRTWQKGSMVCETRKRIQAIGNSVLIAFSMYIHLIMAFLEKSRGLLGTTNSMTSPAMSVFVMWGQ